MRIQKDKLTGNDCQRPSNKQDDFVGPVTCDVMRTSLGDQLVAPFPMMMGTLGRTWDVSRVSGSSSHSSAYWSVPSVSPRRLDTKKSFPMAGSHTGPCDSGTPPITHWGNSQTVKLLHQVHHHYTGYLFEVLLDVC